jgi:mannose-6-phosphate isomerase-like protein (cupin superfamily)
MIISKETAPHYQWAETCTGWVFVENENLSVKQERMPAHTSEQLHYHEKAQQFFFILKGTATFEVENETTAVKANEGFYIEAGKKHRILNNANDDLEFILSSHPTTKGDRVNV